MRKLAKVGPCMVVVKCSGVSAVCVFVGHLQDICYEKALCVQVMQQIQVHVSVFQDCVKVGQLLLCLIAAVLLDMNW